MCSDDWFIDSPVGIYKLQSVVKDLCHSAGITGYFTNHSLREMAATRMYNSGVDEQVISEVTGHRSMCVHCYKKTCNNQKQYACQSLYQPCPKASYSTSEIAKKHIRFH